MKVVIAGGGVAALEAAIALRKLAAGRVTITMLAPETELVYQPLSVGAPFAAGGAKRYPLANMASDLDVELRHDGLESVNAEQQSVRTSAGDELPYDALLVAVGASREPAYEHVTTFRGQEDTEPVHGLIQDLEEGYLSRIAFVVPPAITWTLPLYELALMTAKRLREMSIADAEVTVVTPEESPLAVFGRQASESVAELLREAGVNLETGTRAEIERRGEIVLRPQGRRLEADRIIALPRMVGRAIEGLSSDEAGFIPIDQHARVPGAPGVYAAGDGTIFPVKQGGIACQQADAAARAIAADAGAAVEPEPFRPVLRGQLLTGGAPRFMHHHLEGGHGEDSQVSEETLWWPPSKIAGRYLAPYLGEAQEAEQERDVGETPLDPQLLGPVVSRMWI